MEYTKAITVRVKEPDYNMLTALAEKEETTISNVIRNYIVKHLRGGENK